MRRLQSCLSALLLVFALGASSCAKESTLGTSESGSPSGSPTTPALIETTGELAIVSPEPGSVFPPDEVPVRLSLTGAEVIDEATTKMRPDEGHVHVKLDNQTVTLLAGLEFDLAEILGKPLEPGLHILEVEFVAGNHLPFSPREIEQLTFTVHR